jgi:ribosomal-protein-alanine N-acetyltransferase
MSKRPEIRAMTRRDVSACEEIVSRSSPWNRLGEGIDFTLFLSGKKSSLRASVCIIDGSVAGFIVFTSDPVFARGGYLRAIGVAPQMRKRGVGRALMNYAEKTTGRCSRNFYLCVSSFNRSAQRFYKKLGYSLVGRLPGLITPGASEFIFWKKLRNNPHS